MASKGFPRQDVEEEYFIYRDTGCELAPACLSCPLPQCKYDMPFLISTEKANRNRTIVELTGKGLRIIDIAREAGCNEKTVRLVLKATTG